MTTDRLDHQRWWSSSRIEYDSQVKASHTAWDSSPDPLQHLQQELLKLLHLSVVQSFYRH